MTTKLYQIEYFRRKHKNESYYIIPMQQCRGQQHNKKHSFHTRRLGTITKQDLQIITVNGQERIKAILTLT